MFKKTQRSHPPNPGAPRRAFPQARPQRCTWTTSRHASRITRHVFEGHPENKAWRKARLGVSIARQSEGGRVETVRRGRAGEKRDFFNISARRSFMSLSTPNHLPISTKQDRTRMPTRPDSSNRSEEVRTKLVRLTVNLPTDLADRMRDAVYWTPGLTLAWFVASSIRASLTELETINRAPFPKRARQLRAGRPRLMGQSLKLRPRLSANGTFPLTDGSAPLPTVSRSTHE
jgi:hypothetical protein